MKKYNRLLVSSFYLCGLVFLVGCQNNSSKNNNSAETDSASSETSTNTKSNELIMLPSNNYRIYEDEILIALPNKYRKAQSNSEDEAKEDGVMIRLVGDKDLKEDDFYLDVTAKQVYSENDSIKAFVIIGLSYVHGMGAVGGWCDAVLLYFNKDKWHALDYLKQIGGSVRGGNHGGCNGFIQNGPNSILAEVEGSTFWSGSGYSAISLVGAMNNHIRIAGGFLSSWSSDGGFQREVSCSVNHNYKKSKSSYLDLELNFKDNIKNKKDVKKYPFKDGKYDIPDWPFGCKLDF